MSFFDNIIKESNSISGLTPELKAIYVYNLFKNNKEPIIVLNNSLYEANDFYQRLINYTEDVLFFPMDDFLTSEALAISPEFEITRIETLNELIKNEKKIVVTCLMGFLRFIPSKKEYTNKIIKFFKDKEYNIKKIVQDLIDIGYSRETIVNKTGEIAVRGYVIDIFPIFEKNPIRLEFWGETIDSIRYFDENTQISFEKIDSVEIYPCTELLPDVITSKNSSDIKNVRSFNICDYFTDFKLVYNDYNSVIKGYELLLDEINNYNKDQVISKNYMNNLNNIKISNPYYLFEFNNTTFNVDITQNYNSYENQEFPKEITKINDILNKHIKNNKTIVICLNDRYKINKIIDNIDNKNIFITNENEILENKINLIIKKITSGFVYNNYIVISESELFNNKKSISKYKSNFKYGNKIRDLTKLNIGDYIVHSLYGIGRYVGLKTLTKNGLKKDYLTVEYKDSDKLYIPVEKIDLISKFSSNEGIIPKINKLGSSEWEKTKLKVRKRIEDIAGELIELYAKREASEGFKFDEDDENQLAFEKEFPYEETVDQIKVIEEIKKDMQNSKPMDRLLCGDVGFGKTEVAFRAIFKAVFSGKQVAYLCPTTILSSQHYNNAIERFKDFPIKIEILNRFVSSKKVNQIKDELKKGKIDIVIGTHRLLSDDIVFKDLGLLVIDEEQRFGVKHKEKIKIYKNNIDVLTLSATPIPRTLQMSMMGIRNLSLLETPPTNRYPVQTYVLEENNSIIKDAIYKEITRNGQVFILYNYVSDIERKASEINKLVPDAKILFAHGQMSKTELENVMIKFINREADILICTTIIETGIDIASANTLIIIDADRFGLSQLYQIRGRVGRSNKIAYCYLMYNKQKTLSDIAQKRLNVIKQFTELGSGFAIAMRDLSIRGAGDILGSEQAGFIDTIGIDLYLKMLSEEVNKLRGFSTVQEEIKEDKPLIEISTTIEDDYVSDIDLKIEIHKKINEIDSYDKLNRVKEEIEDRFGNISEQLYIYMHEEWFEKICKELNIKDIRQTNNFIEINLPSELTEKIDGQKLFFEVSNISRMFRFGMKSKKLLITLDILKLDKHFIYYLLDLVILLQKMCIKK
ncbi:MAG: transcription-repair coupling factor [Bacilli bacterium]|nr:transcription-repair coupling factor [Bacilli bacterium]